MAQLIVRLLSWLASKAVLYLVILTLLLGIFVIKMVPPMVVKYHEDQLEQAIAQLGESKALVGELGERAQAINRQLEAKAQRIRELEKKGEQFEQLWNQVKHFFQRKDLQGEKQRLEESKQELWKQQRQLLTAKRDLRILNGESEDELKRKELLRNEKEEQLREIKDMRAALDSLMQNELRQMAWVALVILATMILIPFLWKCVAFYLIAPLAQSSEPILLGADSPASAEISVTASHPAQRLALDMGEVLMTKASYLQGSMGNFAKGTKWLMDWNYPFSSVAAGLFILIKIRNTGKEAGQVTLSTSEDAMEELAIVKIPEGRSMVFRPHYLIAVAHPIGSPPRIKSRWVFGKLHAWINLQFRYMIIEGQAKLVFSAQRGLQMEEVLPSLPGRRVNSHLTAAFSPHLHYSPKRAETFVAYLWGKNALFDDFFQGSGIVIQQQVTGKKRNPAARIWEAVFGAIGKVFGI